MSRVLNSISQIIYIAKKARKQIAKGRYSSTKRLFKKIMKIKEKELGYIAVEAGSTKFYKQCLFTHRDVKRTYKEFEYLNSTQIDKTLARIVKLEKQQLSNLTNAKKGLTREIIKSIDPYIRDLVNDINKLSFVKKTHYSCSGHLPKKVEPYIKIEYDWGSKTKHNIKAFHKGLISIVKKAGFVRPFHGKTFGPLMRVYQEIFRKTITYYLGFSVELLFERSGKEYKKEIIRQWNQIFRLVRKFKDRDSLSYKREKRYIKKTPDLLGMTESD